MAQILKTYGDIISAVREALGVQSSDLTATNKIKRLINMVYLDEVVPHKRWRWLEKETTVVHEGYYATGLAAATHDSTTITLDTAPNVSLGSFAGAPTFEVVGTVNFAVQLKFLEAVSDATISVESNTPLPFQSI